MAAVAKALGDPVRLQLVDVLRKHAGKVCVCELVPLFDLSQPTVSHHLKVLREAGIVDSERRGPVGLLLRQPRGAGGADRMAELTDHDDIRDVVRERYAGEAAPRRWRDAAAAACCGRARSRRLRLRRRDAAGDACGGATVFGAAPLRDRGARRAARRGGSSPRSAAAIPTAVADLHEGETVLDLGSGGGIDVLLSARRVGPTGKAYGLDMTDEMLDARPRERSARPASTNVEFLKGTIEDDPAARRLGRRRHLQLRDQPLRRQAARCCARPPASCGPAGASPSPT